MKAPKFPNKKKPAAAPQKPDSAPSHGGKNQVGAATASRKSGRLDLEREAMKEADRFMDQHQKMFENLAKR